MCLFLLNQKVEMAEVYLKGCELLYSEQYLKNIGMAIKVVLKCEFSTYPY